MRAEVMQHFGLAVPFKQSGYYETEHHKDLIKDVRGAVMEGRLVAICGVIGSGKTVLLRRLTKNAARRQESDRLQICRRG